MINGNSVCIFQILLHVLDIVSDRLLSLLTADELRNVVHRAWAVEGVHGNQVGELRWLQLAQIFLHTRTFKLERADGAPLAVKFVCQLVVDWNMVNIDVDAMCLFHIGYGLFDERERAQPQKVHLD